MQDIKVPDIRTIYSLISGDIRYVRYSIIVHNGKCPSEGVETTQIRHLKTDTLSVSYHHMKTENIRQ